MEYPNRKSPRIRDYDYSSHNYYFITICTHEKKCIFGNIGALNSFGLIAEQALLKIPKIYPQIVVDKYVVMPNHVHAILINGKNEKSEKLPNVSRVIGQYKMSVTKEIRKIYPDFEVWQRSFHDHVIRNREGYEKIWEYIHYNPLKWEEDCFYLPY